jgi:hypothetical protein
MAELSIAISPPSLKLRRALLAIHPRGKPRGILAKESKTGVGNGKRRPAGKAMENYTDLDFL